MHQPHICRSGLQASITTAAASRIGAGCTNRTSAGQVSKPPSQQLLLPGLFTDAAAAAASAAALVTQDLASAKEYDKLVGMLCCTATKPEQQAQQ
jgi:hypothetical protein